MTDDINIDMGEYLIECDKDKILWRLTDKFSSNSWEFESLDEVIHKIRREVESVEIES